MIYDYTKALELVEKMNKQLPIPASPTKQFIQAIKGSTIEISKNQELQIDSVLYMGDEGGISCSISMPKSSKKVVVTSLTHIQIPFSHPLSKEIVQYQKRRIKKLSRR